MNEYERRKEQTNKQQCVMIVRTVWYPSIIIIIIMNLRSPLHSTTHTPTHAPREETIDQSILQKREPTIDDATTRRHTHTHHHHTLPLLLLLLLLHGREPLQPGHIILLHTPVGPSVRRFRGRSTYMMMMMMMMIDPKKQPTSSHNHHNMQTDRQTDAPRVL